MTRKLPKQVLKKGGIQRGFAPDTSKSPIVERDLDAPEESLLDTVERELKGDGITPFDNTDILQDYLRLPADITEEASKELGRYFNAFTQQKVWTRTLLSRVSIMIRELESDLDEIRFVTYSDLPPKMAVKEKELQVKGIAKEQIDELNILVSKRIMLGDYLDNLIDVLFVISREISRRESDWNTEQRDNSIDKKRR